MGMKMNQKGFTATELLIAVILLIIVTAAATPFILGTIQGYRLRTAAWQVAGDLRLARQKSVASGRPFKLTFKNKDASTDPNSYIVERQEVSGAWTRDPAPRIYLQTPGGPTYVMIDSTSTPSGGVINFSANGTVPTAGTINLVDARGKQYKVIINSVGRVSVNKI